MLIPNSLTIRDRERTATFHADQWLDLRSNPDNYQSLGIFFVRSYFTDEDAIEKAKRKDQPLGPKLQQIADTAEKIDLSHQERFRVVRYAVAEALIYLANHAPANGSIDFLIKDVSIGYEGHGTCNLSAVGYQRL